MIQHRIVQVVLDTPLDFYFDYRYPAEAENFPSPGIGMLVVVPFGRREEVGLVVEVKEESEIDENKLKDVVCVIGEIPPLRTDWIELCRFAAGYYQRPLGEVALPSIPKNVRANKKLALKRALKAAVQTVGNAEATNKEKPVLLKAQKDAVLAIVQTQGFRPFVLYGVTGSGKTEIYLQAIEEKLNQSNDVQVLIMVPEINLTPQLEISVRSRFPGVSIATLHSRLTESERLKNWLQIHTGAARIVLGTRLAILACNAEIRSDRCR